MKVIELLSVLHDSVNVRIVDNENEGVLSYYDGKNSIDEQYNECEIEKVYNDGNYITILIDDELSDIYNQAKEDFQELKEIVSNTDLSLEELCDELGGHNLSYKLFDLNYKSICATIIRTEERLRLLNSVEVWNDKNYQLIDWDFRPE